MMRWTWHLVAAMAAALPEQHYQLRRSERAGPQPAAVCEPEDAKHAPWCNASLSFQRRAEALVANLTLNEKVGLFLNSASAIPRIHWPAYQWWSEALHGVARLGLATSWPQVIGIGATFSKDLFWQLGNMTSAEARGKAGGMGHTYWAPNINIFRDPRWGRGQETPGEDPALTSEYAARFLAGMQGADLRFLKVSACLKHFSAYSQETNREGVGVAVTAQDMEDTYLPAFKAGVQRGRASCIMCSYNAETYGAGIFGVGAQGGAIPSCANQFTMTELGRKTWGFDGYIVSDCYAANRVQDRHHYTNRTHDTINATLSAGMDLECGNTLSSANMADWYRSGPEAERLADAALRRLFAVQLRLGWADPPAEVPWSGYGGEVVDTLGHRALAKRAAAESLVLLENRGSALPLSSERVRMLAVLGPHANATTAMQGNYAGTAPFLISPCEGLGRHTAVDCVVPAGCAVSAGNCWNEVTADAVASSDAVVIVVGLDQSQEREGVDRRDLLLPGEQRQLLSTAAEAARGKPLVVVVMSGSAVDVRFAKDDRRIDGLLWCGYPGQAGGEAIAEALFGITNSFGKLPMTWYDNNYTRAVGLEDYAMRPNRSRGYPGRTHRFYTGTPVYRFGDGLSYTRFEHSMGLSAVAPLDRTSAQSRDGVVAIAAVSVANVGALAGDEVLLLFGAPPGAGRHGRPSEQLLAFSRVTLAVGETREERFELTAEHLRLAGRDGSRERAPGTWRFWLGPRGASSAQTLEVPAAEVLI